MMYKLFFAATFGLAITVIRAAPTPIDAATLLKNGEEAQALNKEFRGLREVDPCKDGETACIGKSIAKCQGTTWETTQGQCSNSQFCFALPSVSSPGTRITCASQKSAANLIDASGATGGIFGQASASPSASKGDAAERGPSVSSAAPITAPSTIISDFTPAATSDSPSPTLARSPASASGDSGDGTRSQQPCTMSMSDNPSQPTLTAAPNTAPSPSTEPAAVSVSSVVVPSASPASTAGPQRVTVTVTLVPSQETTLAPQTRTISPQDASALVASIDAAYSTPVSSPVLPPSPLATNSANANNAVPSASATLSPTPIKESSGSY